VLDRPRRRIEAAPCDLIVPLQMSHAAADDLLARLDRLNRTPVDSLVIGNARAAL